jgi:hypothetical protein
MCHRSIWIKIGDRFSYHEAKVRQTPMPRLKCEIHVEDTREYLACIHVMIGGPISLHQEVTEHTPSRDGEAGFMVCSDCELLQAVQR